ncbi:hypothetical protein GCM10010350_79540 [Streptomyces galilaeus]|nr:hypothetical protein GCM10010350_79540 [Streptomyces galilaeus]
MKRPFQRAGTQPEPLATGPGPRVESIGDRSVAIEGDNYAPILTGDHSRVVTLPREALRPPAEVTAPAGVGNLPIRPGLFVGRTAELDQMDRALATPGGVVVQAVHGLGGIGKSTLAAHWAATRPHGHAPVWWISADSRAAVQQGLADLAIALQPALASALTAEILAERAAQWLATHTGWLIILDNVSDPADIASLLARAAGGRFLITSRLATAWNPAIARVPLGILTQAESLVLLTRVTTAAGPREMDGAAELCEELGHLPLAVEQVAAYLAQNPLTTPRAYLRLLAEHPATMYRQGAVTTPAERTTARIWTITLDRITAVQPQAVDLLRTLAWYAPENIPVILTGDPTDPSAHDALGLLTAYSMITPDPGTGTLAIHRLVQALARTPDPDDPHRTPHHIDQAVHQATVSLDAALPASWDTWRTLLPHIDALSGYAPPQPPTPSPPQTSSTAPETSSADRACRPARSNTTSEPSPTSNGYGERTIPTLCPPATTWPAPTGKRGSRAAPSPYTSRPSPTACGCWARTTPTPCSPATTSPTRTSRRGT